jgi:magnesium chelatase subunit I
LHFVINELPDLQARIQFVLFNILQEDIQIRGFKLRMPLDLSLYSLQTQKTYESWEHSDSIERQNRSQILTHHPERYKLPTITEQEAKLDAIQSDMVHVPLGKDLLEQISFGSEKVNLSIIKVGCS